MRIPASIRGLLFILIGAISCTIISYCGTNGERDLKNRILSLAKDKDPRLLDVIGRIDKLRTHEAINLHVELTDYYLGEGATETLLEKATEIGPEIVPFLVEKKNTPIKCHDRYRALCVKSVAERNRKIGWMLNAIQKGIVLYAVFPDNIQAEVKSDMRIIRIFLVDYKMKKRELPSDLDTLRSFAWTEYGYKLRIWDYSGEPYRYSPLTSGQYILELDEDSL